MYLPFVYYSVWCSSKKYPYPSTGRFSFSLNGPPFWKCQLCFKLVLKLWLFKAPIPSVDISWNLIVMECCYPACLPILHQIYDRIWIRVHNLLSSLNITDILLFESLLSYKIMKWWSAFLMKVNTKTDLVKQRQNVQVLKLDQYVLKQNLSWQ